MVDVVGLGVTTVVMTVVNGVVGKGSMIIVLVVHVGSLVNCAEAAASQASYFSKYQI